MNNFENFKDIIGTKYCVSLNSGTDALILALIALGKRRPLFPLSLFSTVRYITPQCNTRFC